MTQHEQQPGQRAVALQTAALLMSVVKLDPPGDVADLEEITIGMADRFAYWLATGRAKAGARR